MYNDVVKLASTCAVLAVLFVGATQNHWFEKGGAILRAATAPRAAPFAPAPMQVAYQTPAQAAPVAANTRGAVELQPDSFAHYFAEVEVDGARIRALIDTGASYLSLTAEDARLLNIDPPRSAYTLRTQTANGIAMSAPVHLREVRIGSITVYDVDALVSEPGKMNVTLLGMSFLKKLGSFQVADGRFVMKQ